MPTALVTGATGILGREVVNALGQDKQTWSTVYALSRSQQLQWPSNVKQQQLDLQASAQEQAKELGDIKPEYIFFAAYLAKDSEEEATKVNGAMLENFLDALKISGASKHVKRIVLTTGAKQYGVHFGMPKMPMEESDRWLSDERPPNFYYKQQRTLAQKSEEQGWDWVVTYPNDVIGVAKGNFMNLATSLGIYCAVTKELGEELMWPGKMAVWTQFGVSTNADIFRFRQSRLLLNVRRLHQLQITRTLQPLGRAREESQGQQTSFQHGQWRHPKLAEHVAEAGSKIRYQDTRAHVQRRGGEGQGRP